MSVEQNLETVRAFYASGPATDDSGRYVHVSDDIVWHVPGDNPVSGTYRGAAEVLEVIPERMQPLDVWEIDLVDLMGNADLVMATVRLRAQRGDHAVDCAAGHVFRLDEAARIVEAWGFITAQAEIDELFAAGPSTS